MFRQLEPSRVKLSHPPVPENIFITSSRRRISVKPFGESLFASVVFLFFNLSWHVRVTILAFAGLRIRFFVVRVPVACLFRSRVAYYVPLTMQHSCNYRTTRPSIWNTRFSPFGHDRRFIGQSPPAFGGFRNLSPGTQPNRLELLRCFAKSEVPTESCYRRRIIWM